MTDRVKEVIERETKTNDYLAQDRYQKGTSIRKTREQIQAEIKARRATEFTPIHTFEDWSGV